MDFSELANPSTWLSPTNIILCLLEDECSLLLYSLIVSRKLLMKWLNEPLGTLLLFCLYLELEFIFVTPFTIVGMGRLHLLSPILEGCGCPNNEMYDFCFELLMRASSSVVLGVVDVFSWEVSHWLFYIWRECRVIELLKIKFVRKNSVTPS